MRIFSPSGLKIWGYNSVGKDVRRGFYGVAADFILEKNGILSAVEAKCWSAYLEGRLRKITLKNIERIRKSVGCFSTTIYREIYF
jgi:Holliday junction resolvase-like predicted endonuclease